MWHVIEKDNDKLKLEMQNKYKTLDNKLKKLSEKQVTTNDLKKTHNRMLSPQMLAGLGFWLGTSYASLRQPQF
jgi:hypothetical protein